MTLDENCRLYIYTHIVYTYIHTYIHIYIIQGIVEIMTDDLMQSNKGPLAGNRSNGTYLETQYTQYKVILLCEFYSRD